MVTGRGFLNWLEEEKRGCRSRIWGALRIGFSIVVGFVKRIIVRVDFVL
jgi:hypothetical protein